MKAVLQLFRKAIGWPLFVWCAAFLIWQMVSAYYWEIPSGYTSVQLTNILVGLDLAGFVLGMWFLGYLFNVAIRTASGQNRPLYPLALKDSFVMGIHIISRFVFVSLPVIALLGYAIMRDEPFGMQFFDIFVLLYFMFVFVPFCVYFVENSEKLPYLFTWSFFKKNLDICFLFLVLSALLNCIWKEAFEWIYSLLLDTPVYTRKETSLALLIYAFGFYLTSFDAVLLGYIVGKIKAFSTKVEKQPVSVQKLSVEVKPVANKKTGAKKVAVTSKSVKKKTASKATAKKMTAKKKTKSKTVKK